VLLDTGAHIIDLVCWWLGGEPELVDYRDDSCGGTEAVAHIDLREGDRTASVRLSWLSKLSNRYCVEGERGRVEGGAYDWGAMDVSDASGRTRNERASAGHQDFEDFAARLIDNFIDVLRGTATPLVPGEEVLASIGLIDACYRNRKRVEMPWQDAWKGNPHA
jgi:predicted dehydrogenase